MSDSRAVVVSNPAPVEKKFTEKTSNVNALAGRFEVVQFANAEFMKIDGKFMPFTSHNFANFVYGVLGAGVRKNQINDLEHFYRAMAKDINKYSRYVVMGQRVWDMTTAEFVAEPDIDIYQYAIFETKYEPIMPTERHSNKFIMDLACGDIEVYEDIFKSIAPLILTTKPAGVIWWQGYGANGKSSLAKLIHKIFTTALADLDIKSIEEERDTPSLNGKLGNVVLEASDHYVQNARLYKSIGAHEDFSVHKFHSQETTRVNGNVHHIFNCNNMPGFADKTDGAKRRTLIIQFKNKFQDDPTFEKRTFTKEFIRRFLGEVIQYAQEMRDCGYKYNFGVATQKTKANYDTSANTAETFIMEMVGTDICGFMNFKNFYNIYENWCAEDGFVPLKITNFRRTAIDCGFERKSIRNDDGVAKKVYVLNSVKPTEVELVKHTAGIYRRKGSPFTGILNPIMTEVDEETIAEWGDL